MSDRIYASVLYIALIVGSSWAAVAMGEALTREAMTKLALSTTVSDPRPSRVDTYLASKEHAPVPQKSEPLVPTAPSLPVGTLAKALDEAEQTGNTQAGNGETEKKAPPPLSIPEAEKKASPLPVIPEAQKPRVAGWVKRLPRRAIPAPAREDTSGHIIMRSLRAEM